MPSKQPSNPPQPDITRTIEETLQLFQRDIERHYGGRTVGKTLTGDEAVQKLVALYHDGMADGYKTGYIKGQLEAREDMRELNQ